MLKKYILIFILVSSFLLGCTTILMAQNAPVTTCATVSGAIPGTVGVPLTVAGFTGIGAISLSLDYDYSVIQFLQGMPNPALPGFLAGDVNLGNGYHRINMGWYGTANSLTDGSTIMTLNFTYVSGSTPLIWYEDGSSCEYANAMGIALNDLPTSAYYLNGYICGATGNPGPVAGNNTVCQGQAGESYSVAPLANVTGYAWTVPTGAAIINGQNTNSITVDFSASAVSGNVTVCGVNACGNGPLSQLAVTVNALPIANAGNDVFIPYGTSTTLNAASGGTGSFIYQWSPANLLVNPNIQNPQTVNLTSTTIFTLVVTNLASGCHASDDVIVTITGGPLSVNPTAVPGNICQGGSAQLYANAGSGSGNYTYLWTCVPPGTPPWSSIQANPLVSPGSPTLYQVSVNDGFTTVSGSVNLAVSELPTATISGGDSLCGTNVTTLQVDLTGTPPWSFTWSNGITSVTVSNQYTTPYQITTGDQGTYTILALQDANCSGTPYGSASVYVFPYPPAPQITVTGSSLFSSECCGNQWYLNQSAIPGATGQTYVASTSGNYSDIVTLNKCSSDTSETVVVIVGIDEMNERQVSLAPNPAGDFVNIRYPWRKTGNVIITVSSADGRTCSRYHFKSPGEHHELTINVGGFAHGLYFVTVAGGDFVTVRKLVVN